MFIIESNLHQIMFYYLIFIHYWFNSDLRSLFFQGTINFLAEVISPHLSSNPCYLFFILAKFSYFGIPNHLFAFLSLSQLFHFWIFPVDFLCFRETRYWFLKFDHLYFFLLLPLHLQVHCHVRQKSIFFFYWVYFGHQYSFRKIEKCHQI